MTLLQLLFGPAQSYGSLPQRLQASTAWRVTQFLAQTNHPLIPFNMSFPLLRTQAAVAHTFHPSIWHVEAKRIGRVMS